MIKEDSKINDLISYEDKTYVIESIHEFNLYCIVYQLKNVVNGNIIFLTNKKKNEKALYKIGELVTWLDKKTKERKYGLIYNTIFYTNGEIRYRIMESQDKQMHTIIEKALTLIGEIK